MDLVRGEHDPRSYAEHTGHELRAGEDPDPDNPGAEENQVGGVEEASCPRRALRA